MFDSVGNPIPSSQFAPIDHHLNVSSQNQHAVDSKANNPQVKETGTSKVPSSSTQELSPEEQKQLQELKARDKEVKAHEAAHQAAAGGLATGGASFTYKTGPDGQRYAVGGEVSIDVSPASTPEATIAKMEQVKHAAMAPADPSAADRAVAASAAQQQAQAKAELIQENQVEKTEDSTTLAPDQNQFINDPKIENSKIESYHEDLDLSPETFNKFV